MNASSAHRDLFRHVSADKAAFYRTIMEVFAAAKRQFRPYLRPDEVLREAAWSGGPPSLEEVRAGLTQLVEWGNLESQPDTARVASIDDFYLARFLYRLSHGGEAVESALAAFAQALRRRGELQSVALEDIHARLEALIALAAERAPDDAKVHEVLRDLVRSQRGNPAGRCGCRGWFQETADRLPGTNRRRVWASTVRIPGHSASDQEIFCAVNIKSFLEYRGHVLRRGAPIARVGARGGQASVSAQGRCCRRAHFKTHRAYEATHPGRAETSCRGRGFFRSGAPGHLRTRRPDCGAGAIRRRAGCRNHCVAHADRVSAATSSAALAVATLRTLPPATPFLTATSSAAIDTAISPGVRLPI